MPGTNLLYDKAGLDPDDASDCAAAQGSMLHYPFYSARQIFQDSHMVLGCTSYEGYPYHERRIEQGSLIALEGTIYNRTRQEVMGVLMEVLTSLGTKNAVEKALAAFARDADGEYVCLVYDARTHGLLVFNDFLGRLPLYYRCQGTRFALSREVKFLVPFFEPPRLNARGVMEYLLYGAPLGESTLVEGIISVHPGSWLAIDPERGLTTGAYPVPDFGSSDLETRMTDAEGIGSCFLEGLRNRVESTTGSKPVLSLSGGLDSRAVLAGLCRLDRPPLAVTTPGPELDSARAVARRFGVEIIVLGSSGDQSPTAHRRYALLKDGLDCHPGLPHLYTFMEDLLRECGRDIIYYTGIMGGEITRHYNVTSGLGTVDKVARHLLHTKAYYKYSTQKVAALLGLHEGDMKDHMEDLLRSFPVAAPAKKYLAFRHEFYRRYTGEAEDRNRFYCWTVSPFYSARFYRMMLCIDEQRKGIRLWRDVLRCLDPRAVKDAYFNRGVSLEGELGIALISAAERLIRVAPVKRVAQALVHRANETRARLKPPPLSSVRQSLLEMLEEPRIRGLFSSQAAGVVRSEPDPLGLERMHILCSYAEAAGVRAPLA